MLSIQLPHKLQIPGRKAVDAMHMDLASNLSCMHGSMLHAKQPPDRRSSASLLPQLATS